MNCPKCDADNWYFRPGRKKPECRACKLHLNRHWKENNRERETLTRRAYQKTGQYKTYNRLWKRHDRQRHPTKYHVQDRVRRLSRRPYLIAYSHRYYYAHRNTFLQCRKEWYRTHRAQSRSTSLRVKAAGRTNLLDWYVKRLICDRTHIPPSDVPNELIELQRVLVQIKRLCKKHKHHKHHKT